jgi:ATP synthase protein I
MDERDTRDPLRDLGQRLDRARAARPGPAAGAADNADADESRSALAIGFRIGLELVVSVFVGAGLGWAFDNWLGTQPWGLIAFLFLGFAAGVMNVFRIALRQERAVGFGPAKSPPPPQGNWSDDED